MSSRSGKKTNIWARRRARRALVQALYQWELSASSVSSVIADFQSGDALKKADDEFFIDLLRKLTATTPALDALYGPLLDREVEKLDPVERAILRLAAFEFSERMDVPYRVVIDEYVELAKVFGAQDSHKYINGVLDNLASSVRTVEVESRG
ncbi:MAG: transcription antitermination factor NusB [Pseudomonadales bacterium]|nr:transcription antitermination factor NusB [Pseudomonadales bacterium]